jgi:hypothetical protein
MAVQLAKSWLSLAEEASHETNSAKLAFLVTELCRALDAEHEREVRSVLTAGLKFDTPMERQNLANEGQVVL